ncbi:MAG: S8 family serine peptidase [Elusimicrobiota bacterium]|jgi:hypothetical protein
MKILKTSLSLSIIAAMLGVMPGVECYRAAAATIRNVRVQSQPGSMGVGAADPSIQAGFVRVPLAGLKVSPAVLSAVKLSPVSQVMPQSRVAAVSVQTNLNVAPQAIAAAAYFSEAQPGAPAPTAFQGLVRELPAFDKMAQGEAKTGADTDFLSRVGAYKSVYSNDSGAVSAGSILGVLSKLTLSLSKKGKPDTSRTPGQSGRDGSGRDTDELGNQRRGSSEGGLGDTDDGMGGGVGQDGIFSNAFSWIQSITLNFGKKGKPDHKPGNQPGGPDNGADGLDGQGNPQRQPGSGGLGDTDDGMGQGGRNDGNFAGVSFGRGMDFRKSQKPDLGGTPGQSGRDGSGRDTDELGNKRRGSGEGGLGDTDDGMGGGVGQDGIFGSAKLPGSASRGRVVVLKPQTSPDDDHLDPDKKGDYPDPDNPGGSGSQDEPVADEPPGDSHTDPSKDLPEPSLPPQSADGSHDSAAAPRTLENGGPVDLIVIFSGTQKPLSQDEHLSFVDLNKGNAVNLYARAQQAMLAQIEEAGLESDTMAAYSATPVGTYSRINAATIRVDADKAAQFRQLLRGRGFSVFDNERREIVQPIPVDPETADPLGRGAVSLEENLRIANADSVLAMARKAWGDPEMGFLGRTLRKPIGLTIHQPQVGVIDTGVDLKHPLLKRVKAMVNMTSGESVDDNGHGSWVTSMVLNYAPWLKTVIHYKTFNGGGATLDDILKALTAAGNDGNLVISNSWGSDAGDPNGPDSLLVKKLAEEGHIMVFAAGNAGSRPNTIGSPAIIYHKDAKTGAIRVVSVAATDRDKKVAYFSSRGPGSRQTKQLPNYPRRPDLAAVGYNTEGAWPTDVGGADRVDPVLGPLRAISGTSMATPAVAGAISLLAMLFGVTKIGEPLDAVVNAVMGTLTKTGQSANDEGDGFIDVAAAYNALKSVLTPAIPGIASRLVLNLARRGYERSLLRQARAEAETVRNEYLSLRAQRQALYDQLHSGLSMYVPHGFKSLEEANAKLTQVEAALQQLEASYPGLVGRA